ncbi:phage protease [Devosia sp.]|uniref:phage protease n=1 Tax=Devosia sp. TaxID=1871048 RepID=UPI001ACA7586|nr:phage protease [Devosia sp.]MBN9334707.1 hypothetical protein [Devosia sp.]
MNQPVNIFEISAATVADQGENWIKLLPAGRFRLRDGRGGDLDAGSVADMQKIVDRTRAYFGSTDLMIDYDHELVRAQKDGGRAEAAGWIKDMQVRVDGIYGRVEWTAAAAAKIRALEYRYISPWFQALKDGRVHQLLNAALVNMPALDLSAIAASLFVSTEDTSMEKIAKALGLADNASQDAILAAITDRHSKIAAAVGLAADAKFDDVVAAVSAGAGGMGRIAAAVGLAGNAALDDIVAAAAGSASQFVPLARFNDLKVQLNDLSASVSKRDVDEAVQAAIDDGKITPAQEIWARNYAGADLAGFKSFAASAQPVVKPQGKDGLPADKVGDLTADQIAAKAQAYIAEQGKVGIVVDIIAAVNHVTEQAGK